MASIRASPPIRSWMWMKYATWLKDWKEFLSGGLSESALDAIRSGERTGRPLGSSAFIEKLERRLKRPLARQKPGPKPKKKAA